MLVDAVVDLFHGDLVPDGAFADAHAQGVQALIHKATQGLKFVDPLRIQRNQDARRAGLLVAGGYHFGTNAPGADQAKFFLDTVQPSEGDVLMLDFENNDGNPSDQMTLLQAREFIREIFLVTAYWPVLYTSSSFIGALLGDRTDLTMCNCPLMIAQYGVAQPGWPKETWTNGWSLWQYAENARLPGFPNPVDASHFAGSQADLVSFFGGSAGARL